MTHNVVRVLGKPRKIYRGTERRDTIKLNEKNLVGYVKVVHQNGKTTETTCYKGKEVEGYQWVWLARRNSRTVKVDVEPVIREVPHSKEEVLEKVKNGELTPEQGIEYLTKVAA